jgi:hypothetical protein
MKRYPALALVALVFLLLVLLGSWVYLKNYAWPGADSTSARATGEPGSRDPTEDPFAEEPVTETDNAAESQPDAGGDSIPLEPDETAETRPTPPPEPVETGPKPQPQASVDKPKDAIVAELKLMKAGVRGDSEASDGLDPFIVSTLASATYRESVTTLFEDIRRGRLGTDGTVIQSAGKDAPEPRRFLTGQLLWPALSSEQQTELKDDKRNQAVVYLDRLPEFRSVVVDPDGRFALPVTERLADDFGSKGLRIVVHSPIYEIAGGFEAVLVKRDDGPIRIQLQLAPVLEVTVDVTPPEAIAAGVRVWLERRGLPGTPDFDDSLYMSARVPDSGRLVFTVPERYGELRVGASGEVWHSGLAQAVKLRDWKATKVKVLLPLVNERCDRVTGQVILANGNPVEAARLESTHFGATTWTAPDGGFDLFVPFDVMKTTRQFMVTRSGFRPEAVPLETSRQGTPGVEGNAPYGPFRVTPAWKVEVALDFPSEVSWAGASSSEQFKATLDDSVRPARWKLTMGWGTGFVMLTSVEGADRVLLWISPEEWEDAFRAYAKGEEVARLSLESFEKAFRKR